MLLIVLLYLTLGAVAGLLAGLFGIGGGVVLVPGLLLIFASHGVDPSVQIVCAIATSLACIAVTAVSSVAAHHRRGGVRWPVFRQLAPGLVVGAVLGAWLADRLPADALRLIFAVFMLGVSARMLRKAPAADGPGRDLPGPAGLTAAGGVIGSVSALVGIGGGTLTVPFLAACRVAMAQAVGTSAACGLPLALAGTITYVVTGWDAAARPPGSLGYVVLPALAAIVTLSVAMAPVGARLAHRVPAATLRRAFAVVLLIVGLRLLIG